MNKTEPNSFISYINLCSNKLSVEQKIKEYFSDQHYTVLSYLKELNNYVTITADYPINRAKLLNALDPYRKFCDSILLVVVFKKKPTELYFPWSLTEFGISDIVFVDNQEQIIEHVQSHFNRYNAINKLVKNADIRKTSELKQSLSARLN